MKMQMKFLNTLFIAICLVSSARGAPLPSAVRDALQQAHIPLTSVGIEVREINVRKPLISVNVEQPMNPASTMKLLTTYAALDILGPAYTWKTEAWLDGKLEQGVLQGDLILKGYGDPKFTIEQFWLWLRELRGRGLREIRGNLVLDRSAFELAPYDPAAFDNDPTRAYNVGPDALLLNFNAIRLHLIPNGEKINVIVEPELAGITLDNRLALVAQGDCENWEDAVSIQIIGNTLLLQGTFPASCGERKQHVSLLPHSGYVHAVFRALWQELGGTLRGELREGTVPASANLFALHQSAPLSELIRDINKFSNNVMARQLFLTLGATTSTPFPLAGLRQDRPQGERLMKPLANRPDLLATPIKSLDMAAYPLRVEGWGEGATFASLARSTQAVHDWLQKQQLDFPELVLENGAGLSRTERISAHNMALLLQAAQHSPMQAEFEASLPIVGVDGSMKKRLKESAAANHAHLKTGTLEGVKAVAGYVRSQGGKEWVVVFFIAHPNAKHGQAAQDALIEWVQKRY